MINEVKQLVVLGKIGKPLVIEVKEGKLKIRGVKEAQEIYSIDNVVPVEEFLSLEDVEKHMTLCPPIFEDYIDITSKDLKELKELCIADISFGSGKLKSVFKNVLVVRSKSSVLKHQGMIEGLFNAFRLNKEIK